MSSTKKVVIIFSSILFVCLVAMGITLGTLIGNAGGIHNLEDIFGRSGFAIDESSELVLTGIDALEINCTSSDIHIVESDEARVELKGTIIPGNEQKYLSVYEEGGTLFIKIKYNTFFNIYTKLDLTVYLPKDSMLDASIDCTSGDIDISDMNFGDFMISRTSGDLSITDCTASSFETDASSGDTQIESSALGSMRLTCRSGEISVVETSGTIYSRATSGGIVLKGVSEAVDLGCTSGEVLIDVATSKVPPIRAGLTSGDIRIFMPADAAFDFSAMTTSGDISSDINISVSGSSLKSFIGEEISGTCNGGGAPVSISVTSGDISIIAK